MGKLRWNDTVWKRTQAVALWSVGFVAVVRELVDTNPVRWPIIGMLLGVPITREWDRQRRQGSDSSEPENGPR